VTPDRQDRRRHRRIINQKAINAGTDEKAKPLCIYVAIARSVPPLRRSLKTARDAGALEYTIIVARRVRAAPLQFLRRSPVARWRVVPRQRMHALIIYDDLSKQAVAIARCPLLLTVAGAKVSAMCSICTAAARTRPRSERGHGAGSLTGSRSSRRQTNDVSALFRPT